VWQISADQEAAWLSGDYTGSRKPMHRATIQKLDVALFPYDAGVDGVLNEATTNRTGKFASLVFNQTYRPVELPNLAHVKWDRDTDQPIGTCTLTFYNTEPLAIGATPIDSYTFDQPGYFTYSRGTNADGSLNGWKDLLIPDRLIRTYAGYGFDPNVGPEDDAHLTPSGVWIITEVQYTTDGMIEVQCSDVGRSLIDHICFPPVVPWAEYPLEWTHHYQVANPDVISPTDSWITPKYDTDSNKPYIGSGITDAGQPYVSSTGSVHGHDGKDAFDGDVNSYWLSVGNRPDWSSAYEYIQGRFATARNVHGVRVNVHGGPYKVYVSIYSGGAWKGSKKIPYRAREVDTNADIKFVYSFSIKKGENKIVKLPKVFTGVTKIRLTFSHLWDSGIGTNYRYRAAVQGMAVSALVNQSVDGGTHTEGNYDDYCADDQTEIFTQRGWLTQDEVQVGDQTLAIDPETGLSGWQTIDSIFRKHRKREMVQRESSVHSSVTTPDHRWLIKDHLGRWTWRTSETLKHGHSIPLTAPRSDHPTVAKYDDALVELAAWFWTEGWTVTQGGCVNACLAQSRRVNPAHCDRIEAALHALAGPAARRDGRKGSWRMRERGDGVVTYGLGQDLTKALLAVAPGKVPTPEFMTSLTQAQLGLYIETSIDADGWRKKDKRFISQSSEERIRAFEFACALAGIGTSVHESRGTWLMTLLAHKQFRPSLTKETRVQYDGIIWCPTLRHHNWLARRNGKVYFTGNTDIVKWFCAWGGLYWPTNGFLTQTDGGIQSLPPASSDPVFPSVPGGRVWGDFEQTGTYGPEPLTIDVFDKKPLLDCISYVRDIVGYTFFIDETGGVIWRQPNFWSVGNYLTPLVGGPVNGARTTETPTLDETTILLDLTTKLSSQNVRERIFVGNVVGNYGAVVSGFNPAPSGLRRVSGWTDQRFANSAECRKMADLIAIRQMFAYRQNSVTIAATPKIQVDDQVRIVESVTGENYLHYVKAISSEWDLASGRWTYDLTTYWLGTSFPDQWAFDPSTLAAETQEYIFQLGLIAGTAGKAYFSTRELNDDESQRSMVKIFDKFKIKKVTVTAPCRVRFYTTVAARDADLNRPHSDPHPPECYFDAIFEKGSLRRSITTGENWNGVGMGTDGYQVPITVTNRAGSKRIIDITIDWETRP
jgi:hypothetical protein